MGFTLLPSVQVLTVDVRERPGELSLLTRTQAAGVSSDGPTPVNLAELSWNAADLRPSAGCGRGRLGPGPSGPISRPAKLGLRSCVLTR